VAHLSWLNCVKPPGRQRTPGKERKAVHLPDAVAVLSRVFESLAPGHPAPLLGESASATHQKVIHRLLRATMPALLAAVRAQSLARLFRALVGPGLASRLGLASLATPVDDLLGRSGGFPQLSPGSA
jgi:hypothetical protein